MAFPAELIFILLGLPTSAGAERMLSTRWVMCMELPPPLCKLNSVLLCIGSLGCSILEFTHVTLPEQHLLVADLVQCETACISLASSISILLYIRPLLHLCDHHAEYPQFNAAL